jgi:hypothetical protein
MHCDFPPLCLAGPTAFGRTGSNAQRPKPAKHQTVRRRRQPRISDFDMRIGAQRTERVPAARLGCIATNDAASDRSKQRKKLPPAERAEAHYARSRPTIIELAELSIFQAHRKQ